MYKQRLSKLLFEDDNNPDKDEENEDEENTGADDSEGDDSKDSNNSDKSKPNEEDTDGESGIRDRDEDQDKRKPLRTPIDPDSSDEIVRETLMDSYTKKLMQALPSLPGYDICKDTEKIFDEIDKDENYKASDSEIKTLEKFIKISENPLGILTKEAINKLFNVPVPSGQLGLTIANPVQMKKGAEQVYGATAVDYAIYEDLQAVLFFPSHKDGEAFKSKTASGEEYIRIALVFAIGAEIKKENAKFFDDILDINAKTLKGGSKDKSTKETPKYLTSLDGNIATISVTAEELKLIQAQPRQKIPLYFKRKGQRKGTQSEPDEAQTQTGDNQNESINRNLVYRKGLSQLFENSDTKGKVYAVDLQYYVVPSAPGEKTLDSGEAFDFELKNEPDKINQYNRALDSTTKSVIDYCSAKYLENMSKYRDAKRTKYSKWNQFAFGGGALGATLLSGGLGAIPIAMLGISGMSLVFDGATAYQKSGDEANAARMGMFTSEDGQFELERGKYTDQSRYDSKYDAYADPNDSNDSRPAAPVAFNTQTIYIANFLDKLARIIYGEHLLDNSNQGKRVININNVPIITDYNTPNSLKKLVGDLKAGDGDTLKDSFLRAEAKVYEAEPKSFEDEAQGRFSSALSSVMSGGDARSKQEKIAAAEGSFDNFFSGVISIFNQLLKQVDGEISGMDGDSSSPTEDALSSAVNNLRQSQAAQGSQPGPARQTREQQSLNDALEKLISAIGNQQHLLRQNADATERNSALIKDLLNRQVESEISDQPYVDNWHEPSSEAPPPSRELEDLLTDRQSQANDSKITLGNLLFENESSEKVPEKSVELLNQLSNTSVQKFIVMMYAANNSEDFDVKMKLLEFLSGKKYESYIKQLVKDEDGSVLKRLSKEIFGEHYSKVKKSLENQKGEIKKILDRKKPKNSKTKKRNTNPKKPKKSNESVDLQSEWRRVWKI